MSTTLSPPAVTATAGPAEGPLEAYRRRVADGLLAADPEQERAAARLDVLFEEMRHYPGAHAARRGLRGLFGRASRTTVRPRGIYLVGDVGRGKSMLMDLFFEVVPVRRKLRIHFHRFMQDVHARLHAMKRADPGLGDPIPPLAQAISTDAILLCFDEFQVNDITDAMILGRLFDALFERGVVVVATANTRPEDLFQGCPGGDAFKPFIAIIRRETDTVPLDSPRDYRRGGLRGMATWHVPADARAELRLDAAFGRLAEGASPGPETLTVMGRPFQVPCSAGGVARFDFEALCDRPLGAGDYLALAARYPALVIDGVPRLGPENFDVARRFIVLVDALYEQKVKLVASAADRPDRIFERGEGAKAFERTASRLEEMQSQAYLDLPHTAWAGPSAALADPGSKD
nr:cell division protein ZapE [uncultured Lichenicoccus sp.]